MEKGWIAVAGQDARQQEAAKALEQAGWRLTEPGSKAQLLLLPMPLRMEEKELANLLAKLRPGTLVLAGVVGSQAAARIEGAGCRLVDYARREELALGNAVPTAEGCLQLLLAGRSRTLWGSRVAITGFGRIAQLVARDLAALGARPLVLARSPAQLARAESWGLDTAPLDQLADRVKGLDCAVNTVPALLFTRQVLAGMEKGALVVDLASAPGGADRQAAQELGVRLEWATGLPARCAPQTAGEILARTVEAIWKERGEMQ